MLSVVVLWQPPKEAQGWITKYHISYRLSSSSSGDLINTVDMDGWATSYWVTGLPRLTTFVVAVRPFTVKGGGSSSSVMGTTEQIGKSKMLEASMWLSCKPSAVVLEELHVISLDVHPGEYMQWCPHILANYYSEVSSGVVQSGPSHKSFIF